MSKSNANTKVNNVPEIPKAPQGMAATLALLTAPVPSSITAKVAPTLSTYAASLAAHVVGFEVRKGGVKVEANTVLATGPKPFNMGAEGTQKHAANTIIAAHAGKPYSAMVAALQAADLWVAIGRPNGAGNYPAWHLVQSAIRQGALLVAPTK